MTTKLNYLDFRSEFKKVVYQKGMVKLAQIWLNNVTRWDRDGSHANAIIKQEANLKAQLDKLSTLLRSRSYDDWKEHSKKITKHLQTVKKAKNDSTKQCNQTKLDNLKFEV